MLQYRPELSSSTTALRHRTPITLMVVLETAFLIKNGVNVYSTRQCLPCGLLLPAASAPTIVLMVSWMISVYSFGRLAVGRGYSRAILNPLLILSVLGQSFAVVDQALILMGVYMAWRGRVGIGSVLIAAAAVLHLHNALYILPIISFKPTNQIVRVLIFMLAFTMFTTIGLHHSQATSPLHYLYSTVGCQLMLHDLHPNLGLWWYMFTEMFDHFRPLFLAVFQLLLLAIIVPSAIRLQSDPLFLCWFVSSVLAVMRPYPTVADYSLSWSLLILHPIILKECEFIVLSSLLALFSLSYLLTIVWYYWVVQGSGNSNFYYAATLAVNAVQMALTVSVVGKWMRGQVKAVNEIEEKDGNIYYQK